MAIIKIFPEKSSTLYSYYPTMNTGIDEIMEISTFESLESTSEVSRGLIKFSQSDILDVMQKVGTSSFDSYLKLYLADASELPLDYSLYIHPISGSWDLGIGRLSNSPITTTGASWYYRNQDSGSPWFLTSSIPADTTASYSTNVGGGLWYSGSIYEYTQSFLSNDSKDIEIKNTNIINAWVSGTINNEGFIIKHSPNLEFTDNPKFELKYFTGNTHTIYPPCLEIRWDNSVYNTGSLSLANNDKIVVTLGNNRGEYQQDSVQQFRINVRDKYPTRTFQTSSLYTTNKVLPSTSYWAIKDYDTEEIVNDFDTNYTKISADSEGNYFTIYMNGLEPERSYKLLIKTVLSNGETLVFEDNNIFKVIR